MDKTVAVIVVTQPDIFHLSCVNITWRHSHHIVNPKIPGNLMSLHFSIVDEVLYSLWLNIVYILETKDI